ncbi:hypothetical protein HII31_09163 [Pseudocercospora fuligena]|uniref:Uncharacterized protein n=1 Tax=Pseudocercospora fuligena TaxID=685502 RepID=A0A8H6VEL8_9PEZI|nr:hypothetical protein HII31_09163 [Pseudocercospora fuligena]
MQLIAVTALLAAAASALPQWVPGRQPLVPNSPLPNLFRQRIAGTDGDENGAYRTQCWCTLGGQFNAFATQLMVQDLNARYPNLVQGQFGVIDANGRGVERNGVAASCNRVPQNPLFINHFRITRWQDADSFFLPDFPNFPYTVDANCQV